MIDFRRRPSCARSLCFGAALLLVGRAHAEAPAAGGENPYVEGAAWAERPTGTSAEGSAAEPEEAPAGDADASPEGLPTAARADAEANDAGNGVAAPSPAAVVRPVESPQAEAPIADHGGLSPQRVTAIALTGLTFLGVGVGTSYAIQSTSRSRQADAQCDPVCSPGAQQLDQEARQAATIAQVAFAVGLVSLGGAAYLWFTEPPRAESAVARAPRSWTVDVSATPGQASGWVRGTF